MSAERFRVIPGGIPEGRSGWRGDEPLVDDKYVPKAPTSRAAHLPPVVQDPDAYFGPKATAVTPLPYVTTYYGSPALADLTSSQRLVYGYVRSWNELGKNCYASAPAIGEACYLSERQVRRIIIALNKKNLLRCTPRPGRTPILEARMNI